jgi:hypothetical protein
LLANKESVTCPRCMPGYIPIKGVDGTSVIQCGEHYS